MQIEAETLGTEFAEYLRRLPGLGCFQRWPRFSAENWFQVELWVHLTQKGAAVVPGPPIPGGKTKADLALRGGTRITTLIEMKCFVQAADANKSSTFPGQLDRLEQLVQDGGVDQAVAVATFSDYGPQALDTKIAQKMERTVWTTGGRQRLTDRMVLVVSTYP